MCCRSGLGEEHQSHSEREHRHRSRRDDESAARKRDRYSHSHSRSPVPPRSRDRGDRPHRGGSLKREASSGRNSPTFVDERSRDSLRDDPRYGGREGVELEEGGGRYHERLPGGSSSRLLTVREDSRHGGSRRGSREIKEMYERERSGGHHRKPIRSSSVRVVGERGGERGGGYSLSLRDDRRPNLKGSRSSPRRPIELSDRGARPGRYDVPTSSSSSHHYSHSSVEREHQRERHPKAREHRERHPKGHRHTDKREGAVDEREVAMSTVETLITISSESGGEEEQGERGRGRDEGRREKIEDLIRDVESGSSSSGEISEGESEREGGASPASKDSDSSSEKEKSSDGIIRIIILRKSVHSHSHILASPPGPLCQLCIVAYKT